MATSAQKWNTYEICKLKSAGRLYAKKKQNYCGVPPPPSGCWSGLDPPILSTDNKLTGTTTNMLQNKIEKNTTTVRRSRDHKHIGLLMKKYLVAS